MRTKAVNVDQVKAYLMARWINEALRDARLGFDDETIAWHASRLELRIYPEKDKARMISSDPELNAQLISYGLSDRNEEDTREAEKQTRLSKFARWS